MWKPIKFVPFALVAGAVAITPARAFAPEAVEGTGPATVHVPIADLDLTSSEDRVSLQHRVERAVWNVCDRDGQPMGLRKTSYVLCVRNAWADALNQVDRALELAGSKSERTAANVNGTGLGSMK
jgi:UrcA family protein